MLKNFSACTQSIVQLLLIRSSLWSIHVICSLESSWYLQNYFKCVKYEYFELSTFKIGLWGTAARSAIKDKIRVSHTIPLPLWLPSVLVPRVVLGPSFPFSLKCNWDVCAQWMHEGWVVSSPVWCSWAFNSKRWSWRLSKKTEKKPTSFCGKQNR